MMENTIFKAVIGAVLSFFIMTNVSVYTMQNSKPRLNQKSVIDKMLAAIALSSPMYRYNQWCAKRIPLAGIPASEEMQALGKEAQIAVGIPADRQVPIQYVPGLDCAAAETNAILIGNHFNDDKNPYGVKRCDMFHEAVHIKYHDAELSGVMFIGSLLAIPLATKMLLKPQGKSKLLYLPALLAGNYFGRALQGKFYPYRERRADIEGHYATQCHVCVTEKAEDLRDTYELAHDIITRCDNKVDLDEAHVNGLAYAKNWIERKKRYLSVEENEIIAAELKQENKVCLFHEQSK